MNYLVKSDNEMGYTTSVKAITREASRLAELIKATSNVEWTTSDPRTSAYKLREAISVGYERYKAGSLDFEKIAKLKSRFIIKEYPNKVVAELRDALPLDILTSRMGVLTIPDVNDEMGIVGACIEHKGTTILFPSARGIDLSMVRNWAAANNSIVNENEQGVTVRQGVENA